jgi:hypothetical protein
MKSFSESTETMIEPVFHVNPRSETDVITVGILPELQIVLKSVFKGMTET